MNNYDLSKEAANIPTPSDLVYKDECVYSFDTPECENGLYVSLVTFLGFNREYATEYFRKTGLKNFLHIKWIRTLKRDQNAENVTPTAASPKRKLTRLAIGLEGGYNEEEKYETEYIYHYVVAPDFGKLIDYKTDKVPQKVQDSIKAIIEHESAITKLKIASTPGTWDGEARQVTLFGKDLMQLETGKRIPPSGWKCEKCDLTENLWLNLTDGAILCGRKYFDGSGGNNHALEHYKQTNYPLAVKLGTISAEGQPDVFCYPDDDLVIDENVDQHLKFWGINMKAMKKSERSIAEMEIEMNERVGEWKTITENESELQPVFGPGFTGMRNLGNSCYINSVMQTLFRVPDFENAFSGDKAQFYFKQFPENPVEDFKIQICKLGNGLLSGKYSKDPGDDTNVNSVGIPPVMFKNVVSKNHKDFSTKQQQDAYEFYVHVLDLINQHFASHQTENPVNALRFLIEDRYKCLITDKVKYNMHEDFALPLFVPLDKAINFNEMQEYLKLQAQKPGMKAGQEIMRYRIELDDCLDRLFGEEIIDSYKNPELEEMTTAAKTTRMLTMPDFLMLRIQKFTLGEDWSPIKLDVSLNMPDVLDLNRFCTSGGLQDGEIEMGELPAQTFEFDKPIIEELVMAGYPEPAAKRACFYTNNQGLEHAANWINAHIEDPDLTTEFIIPKNVPPAFAYDDESLSVLMNMGFSKENAMKALKFTNNNVEAAVNWLFASQWLMDVDEPEPLQQAGQQGQQASSNSNNSSHVDKSAYRNGNGKYKLVAFISHMGSSSQSGHYVCHILKKIPEKEQHQWVIFNDEKVALSVNPPKDLGYLYLYERMTD